MLRDIPLSVQEGVKQLFGTGIRIELLDFSFSGGGCINRGGRLRTSIGDFFVKWNDATTFPEMFEAEAKGLRLLAGAGAIHIPDVIGSGADENFQFLVLAFMKHKTESSDYWEKLGYQMSVLHRTTSDSFGLDHDNYIGSLKQINKQDSSWINFFIERRLSVQLQMAANLRLIEPALIKKFEVLFAKLPALIPVEKSSLIHGDLWSGNIMVNDKGDPSLIDPAVYFGSREADLAMSQLFGGFSPEFYTSYQAGFPLIPGHTERADIYNLYPLLVHLNLFGLSYLSRINTIVRRFN